MSESNPEKAVSPSSLEQGISISEQILLKYKRSNELRQFFETRYQAQCEQLKNLSEDNEGMREQLEEKDEKLEELLGKISELESFISNQEEVHKEATGKLREEKAELSKELEFMGHEHNTKELQLSDLRSKLSKRTDELQSLKEGLNSQIQQVHQAFESQGQS